MTKYRDNEATLFVRSIAPDQITRAEMFILLRIADHWNVRFDCAVVPNKELAADLRITTRHLGSVLHRLAEKGILDYRPGRGSGNCSQFRFPHLASEKEKENRKQSRSKEELSQPAIKEENLNLNQNLTPLTPLAKSQGGNEFTLPEKQASRLRRRMQRLERARNCPVVTTKELEDLVHTACDVELIPYDQA